MHELWGQAAGLIILALFLSNAVTLGKLLKFLCLVFLMGKNKN